MQSVPPARRTALDTAEAGLVRAELRESRPYRNLLRPSSRCRLFVDVTIPLLRVRRVSAPT